MAEIPPNIHPNLLSTAGEPLKPFAPSSVHSPPWVRSAPALRARSHAVGSFCAGAKRSLARGGFVLRRRRVHARPPWVRFAPAPCARSHRGRSEGTLGWGNVHPKNEPA